MIKIASPLSRIKEVAPLAKAGANEFYCCVAPEDWRDSYGMVESISRRNNPFAHLSSYNELEKVVRNSHKYGVRVHAALNEAYNRDQIEFLIKQVETFHEIGVDAVILGDVASLLAVRDAGIPVKIFMGTGGTIFNSQTVELYRSLGVSRMILPRHLSIREIRTIISKTISKTGDDNEERTQFEVFIFRGLCPYIDGFCRFQHGINETLGRKPRVDLACNCRFRIKTIVKGKKPDSDRIKKIKHLMSPRQSLTGCGLCALYDLIKIEGLTSLKIVGREFSSKEKLEDLKLVKKCMDLLDENSSISRDEYFRFCRKEFLEFFDRECGYKDCYYPELGGSSLAYGKEDKKQVCG